jgi:hypothetical protein
MGTSLCFGEAVVLVLMVFKKIVCQSFSFTLLLGFLALGVYLRSALASGSFRQPLE